MSKKGRIVLFFSFCIITFYLYAQNEGNRPYRKFYSDALTLYDMDEPTEKTDSLALTYFLSSADDAIKNKDYQTAVDCFTKAGNIHQTYQRFELSGQFYHRSLALNESALRNETLRYEAFLHLGSAHYFSNIIDSARLYFEKASDIVLGPAGAKLPSQDILYNSLGAIYFESANYLQAKNYFEKGLSATSRETDDDYEDALIGINSNIANCFLRLNRLDSALSIYKSLLVYDSPKEILDIVRQNTAHIYFKLRQYDTALSIYNSLPYGNALNRVKALNDMGRIYMNRQEWQQSEMIFDSAIALNKSISANIHNKDEALAYLYRGQLADKQGLTDEAITWCNEALQEVHLQFTWKGTEDLPSDISLTVSPITLFEILRNKASLLNKKYRITKQQSFLTASLSTYRKAIETANFIKVNFDNDEAKLFFNQNYQPIYGEAIAVAFACCQADRKKFIDDYIFILENYKGTILYQNLQNIQLKSLANVPDSIRSREKSIKQLLAVYTSRINNNAAEADAVQLQKRLSELQVELSRIQKKYENDESYNLYKYQASSTGNSLASVQSGIDEQTALLSYFIADSFIYILCVNKNEAVISRIANDSLFKTHFRHYLNEIYYPSEGKRYDGYASSAWLYNALIRPVENTAAACSKWVIIPGSTLFYLPFETLATDAGQKKYLISSRTVSYHYSFSLLLEKNTHHQGNEYERGTAAGFAPYMEKDVYIEGSGLPELPFSKKEMSALKGDVYTGQNASKKNFLETASRHSLIHLATHASTADSIANWIQFYPGDSNKLDHRLFVQEIYNLELPKTELIILSACETAGGSATSGEGLLSLSRAFTYAGSDGVISTLWKTEDRVTAYLMEKLHQYLDKNYPPEKALQLAKIDLLNNNTLGSQYKTPNYWGNFIYVGKINLEKKDSNYLPWILIPLSGILLVAGVLYQKRKKTIS